MPLIENTNAFTGVAIDKMTIHFFGRGLEKRYPETTERFLERVAHVLAAHGLQPGELLQLVPEEWGWTMKQVGTADGLLAAFGHLQLNWFCEFFGLERHWLDTGEGEIARPLTGYKHIERVVEQLGERGWLDDGLRLSILAVEYDPERCVLDRFHIVFSHLAQRLNEEKDLYLHAWLSPGWDYAHPPARLDAKALARWFWTHHPGGHKVPIPIFPISQSVFDGIRAGDALPGPLYPDWTGPFDCFERRVLAESESKIALECNELPAVLEHMQQHLGITCQLEDRP